MTTRTFPQALRALVDYLESPTSDFEPAGRERLVARLEGDVETFIHNDTEPTTMMVIHDLMEDDDKTPRDVLADYGLLDG